MITRRGLLGILACAVAAISSRLRSPARAAPPADHRYLGWGPKMSEVIILSKRLGVETSRIGPAQFALEVDRLTGLRHPYGIPIEDCAEFWLPTLRAMVEGRAND